MSHRKLFHFSLSFLPIGPIDLSWANETELIIKWRNETLVLAIVIIEPSWSTLSMAEKHQSIHLVIFLVRSPGEDSL
jgi:hypothetical protein